MRRDTSPTDSPGKAKLVEDLRIVVRNPAREYLLFPRIGGSFKSLQLLQRFQRAAFAQKLCLGRQMLPTQIANA